jgi:hypothetical protein
VIFRLSRIHPWSWRHEIETLCRKGILRGLWSTCTSPHHERADALNLVRSKVPNPTL